MMYKCILFHSDYNHLERAFYKKVNLLSGNALLVIEASSVSPATISSTFERQKIKIDKPAVFVAVDSGENYRLHVRPEVINEGMAIPIITSPNLLQCFFSGDPGGFISVFSGVTDVGTFCNNIYRGGRLNNYNWTSKVNSLNILNILKTLPMFDELAKALGL